MAKLSTNIQIAEELVTTEEAAKLIASVIKAVQAAQAQMRKTLEDHGIKMTENQNSLMQTLSQKSEELTQIASAHEVAQDLSTFREVVERSLEEIRQAIPELPPEVDLGGIWEALQALERRVPEEMSAEAIIKKLEAVEANEDKLSIDAIKDLREELKKFKKTIEGGRGTGYPGFRAMRVIQDEGTALAERNRINFVGAGVTVTDDPANDATKVTITSGSGGGTVSTPTGTVNAVNVTFTAAATPLWVISDGVTYFEGAGYSLAGLVITMDIPPSSYIRVVS